MQRTLKLVRLSRTYCTTTRSFTAEISHINLTVPRGTLGTAVEFYEGTLSLTRVPSSQTTRRVWSVHAPSTQIRYRLTSLLGSSLIHPHSKSISRSPQVRKSLKTRPPYATHASSLLLAKPCNSSRPGSMRITKREARARLWRPTSREPSIVVSMAKLVSRAPPDSLYITRRTRKGRRRISTSILCS
jgi:hypothetical protein